MIDAVKGLVVFICMCFLGSEDYVWCQQVGDKGTVDPSLASKSFVGNSLILTPFIESGNIDAAKQKSKVVSVIGDWESYSGYFNVNKECGNYLYFWFIPARINWLKAPVLVWLQGGPGGGSLYGMFEEIGPFNHFTDGLKARNHTWNTENNIIYLDQPVGSGFSFSEKNCFAENMTVVTQELYYALTQFFQMFPELLTNKFFLTGESFAGHYIPSLALHIHKTNPTSKVKLNLVGILIINPLTKLTCHNYADQLYNWGYINEIIREEINQRHKNLTKYAEAKQYREAYDNWNFILFDVLEDVVKLPNRECLTDLPPDRSDYAKWLARKEVRKLIHVGKTQYDDPNWDVYDKLINTIAEPRSREIEELLEAKKYSIGFISGNLDMVCSTASTECLLRELKWYGAEEFLKAARVPWFRRDKLVGWVQSCKKLYLVIVKDAGHAVPYYKPESAKEIVSAMVNAGGKNPADILKNSK